MLRTPNFWILKRRVLKHDILFQRTSSLLADENAWLKTILPGQFLTFPNPHCLSLSVCAPACTVWRVLLLDWTEVVQQWPDLILIMITYWEFNVDIIPDSIPHSGNKESTLGDTLILKSRRNTLALFPLL